MIQMFRYPALLKRLAALLLVTSACNPQPAPEEGAVHFIATMGQALAVSDVTSVRVRVTGTGMEPVEANLTSLRGQWQTVLGGIPAGTNRLFKVDATDASGTLRYSGQTAGITILSGQTAPVYVLLQQTDAAPPVTNTAPVVDWLTASQNVIAPGAMLQLNASAHDPNPDSSLTTRWTATGGSFSSTTSLSTQWTAPTAEGTYTLRLSVNDQFAATNTTSLTVQVTSEASQGSAQVSVGFNTWPKLATINATPARLEAGQSTQLSSSTSDVDGDPLSYNWTTDCVGSFSNRLASSPTFTLTSVSASSCTLTLTVSDGRGGSASGAVTIQTGVFTPNIAPQIDVTYQPSTQARSNDNLELTVEAHDPDNHALAYSWIATTGTISGQNNSPNRTSITWKAPTTCFAEATITLVIRDTQGATTSRDFHMGSLSPCTASNFQVSAMSSSGCSVLTDHSSVTFDDRGGIAITGNHVYYNGDGGLGRFNLGDLSGGTALGPTHDGIFSNLANGASWVLWNNTTQQEASDYPVQVTHLRQLNANGSFTNRLLPLSTALSITSRPAFFSGWNELILHTGSAFSAINLQTGNVTQVTTRAMPSASRCENWGLWGIAEKIGAERYVLYVDSNSIQRLRLSDGQVSNAFTFTDLSDMCSFTVSPSTGRWYWHHELTSQWGGTNETLGFCPATVLNP